MSQSTGVAAAPGVVAAAAAAQPRPPRATAPAAAPGRFGALTASVRRSLAGTPGRMRVVAALAVVVTLAFGLGAGQAFRSASGAPRARRRQRGPGGAGAGHPHQPRARRRRGDQRVPRRRASSPRTSARPTPRPSPGPPSWSRRRRGPSRPTAPPWPRSTPTWSPTPGRIEQARANNRQGLPVGAQYLTEASAGLRARAAPWRSSRARRAPTPTGCETEFGAVGRPCCGSPCPASSPSSCSAVALVWLARRTHRYVNLGLAGCRGRRPGRSGRRLAGAGRRVGAGRAGAHRPVRRRPGHRAGPDRGVRRQGQRDPDADQARVRRDLRHELALSATGDADEPASHRAHRRRPRAGTAT